MHSVDSTIRRGVALLVAAALVMFTVPAVAQTAPPAAPASDSGGSTLHGVVFDSLNGGPLVHGDIRVEGTDLQAFTDSSGAYTVANVPPGARRLAVLHPLLDTLGIRMITQPFDFKPGTPLEADMAVPTAERLAAALCTPAMRARGPALLTGLVKDPDTGQPAVGAKVSLVYYESPLGMKKVPRVREAVADSAGHYRICGLPPDMDGKVQVFRDDISSGEVPAVVANNFLAMHSFSIASQVRVSTITDTAGKSRQVYAGRARVVGTVTDHSGKPLAGARVTMDGTTALAITRSNGDFVLDSLPSGTQSLTVRRLGYSPSYYPVEVSAAAPRKVKIAMSDYVPTLAAMRTEAQVVRGLQLVGYEQRKESGSGIYIDGDKLSKNASEFSQMLRGVPGIRVATAADGIHYQLLPTRGQSGCVNVYLDGNIWRQSQPGDIDEFVQPSEVAAIEVYTPATVPIQFTPPGQAGCTTVVAWTNFTANKERRVKP